MKYDAKPSWIEVVGLEDLDQPARQRAGERWGWIWNPGEISIYVLNLVYPGSGYLGTY